MADRPSGAAPEIAGDAEQARRLLADARIVCPHTDADGLAAGAIAVRARNEDASAPILLPRGHTPFQREALPPSRPAVILDWGVRPFEGDALFVDHHFPEAGPDDGQVVITGYGAVPELTTAVLTGRIAGEAPPWLMAVGAYGDIGERAWRLPDVSGVPKAAVKRLVPLINAPRRVPDGPVRAALELLVEAPSADAALDDARAAVLHDAKSAWTAAFKSALRIAPEVERGIAVIRFSSEYQVHPLVAQAWARRLRPNVVIAANSDYIPGMVNFSTRGGTGDLRSRLRRALPHERGEFAHGHDSATGGSLPPEVFETLIAELRR